MSATVRPNASHDWDRPLVEQANCEYEGDAYVAAAIRTTWCKSKAETTHDTPVAKARHCSPPPSGRASLREYLDKVYAELDVIAAGRGAR